MRAQKSADDRRYHGKTLTAEQQCRLVVDKAIEQLDGWRGPRQLLDIYDDLFPNYPVID
ncbi:MAG: hypothetical protein ABSB35_33685 [Bryobacteraceae bacterium]